MKPFEAEEEEEELYEHHRISVDKGQTLLRIDKFLLDRLPNTSRNRIQNAIEAETVRVNQKSVKSNYKVKPGDLITVSLPHPPRDTEVIPQKIELDIVYEDDDVLMVNKPAGMVVHPAYGNWDGTLVNALVYHFQHLPTARNGQIRPGLVHRIDKDTSGLLVIAKNEFSMAFMAKQFFDHSIERTYYALVWGIVEPDQGTIRSNLGRSVADRRVTTVYPENGDIGKIAITHYKVLERFRYVTLVQCNLETGRTHQIRAHMKHIGHPLFNDEMYGGHKILKGQAVGKYKNFVEHAFTLLPRQALHAKTLGFIHPIKRDWVQFNTELPHDFKTCLEAWRTFEVQNVL